MERLRTRSVGRSHSETVSRYSSYLEWRVERDGVAVEYSIVEALADYWYARAVL